MYLPIHLLFLKDKGINIAEIGIIFGIISLSGLFLEVPLGVLADHLGQKKVAIAGLLLSAVSYLLLLFSQSFFLLVIYALLNGAAEAGLSGALDAVIINSFESEEHAKLLSMFSAIQYSVNAITGLIIGIIYNFDSNLPFWFVILSTLLLIPIIAIFKEVKSENSELDKRKGERKDTKKLLYSLVPVLITAFILG